MLTKLIRATALGVVLFSSVVNAHNRCDMFSSEQLANLQYAYDYGSHFDHGWTLAAIIWRESSAGIKNINLRDPSYGPFHVHLKTASRQCGFDWMEDQERAHKVSVELMNNFTYGAQHAIKVLDYWKKQHKGNYRKMVASYNAGYSWSSEAGQVYVADIVKKIQFLKNNRCIVHGNVIE